jgi:hypothetical protein
MIKEYPVHVDFDFLPPKGMYLSTTWELDEGAEHRGVLHIMSVNALKMAGDETGDRIALPMCVIDEEGTGRALTISMSAHTAGLLIKVLTEALALEPEPPS